MIYYKVLKTLGVRLLVRNDVFESSRCRYQICTDNWILWIHADLIYIWRVQWKKGVRYFTQKWTLSKMLQIPHVVLFRCLKQCSACFFPKVCSFFEILRNMQKTNFSKGILWGPFVEWKTNETFCVAKRWSRY